MNDDAGGGSKHRLGPWTRRLWFTAAGGVVLALAPLAVALVGLALNNSYLATYHWLLYFSVPLGGAITVLSGLAGAVMTVRGLSKGNRDDTRA